MRSLTLIHKLDQDYTTYANSLDTFARDYCALKAPAIESTTRKDHDYGVHKINQTYAKAYALRKDMAEALNMAIIDREESVAEASRLYDTVCELIELQYVLPQINPGC